MQVTDELIRSVVQKCWPTCATAAPPPATQRPDGRQPRGVFDDVDDAVAAATEAQREFEARGLDDRRKAVACIRQICSEQAEQLGREELEETKIGRLAHKIEKLKVIADRIPGVEFLRTDAFSGENGIALQEYAPFGVIGVITPVTHSLPTLACNAINMLAAGNALVCNPHPGGARIACKGVRLFNQAIHEAIGIDNLHHHHREADAGIGPGDLRPPRRAHAVRHRRPRRRPGRPAQPEAGHRRRAGQPAGRRGRDGRPRQRRPLHRRRRRPTTTTSCASAKRKSSPSPSIFDELMEAMTALQGRPAGREADRGADEGGVRHGRRQEASAGVNKDFIGQDAAVLAEKAGFKVPADTELLFGETDESNPFVDHEQMMPFVPFVRVPDVDTAIALAKKYEHGFKHTSIIHSRNVETITRMGREMDTTLFVQNGPSTAGLGSGGEGYLSFSIATPTGEGVTTPLTFTRQRRSTTVGSLRVL